MTFHDKKIEEIFQYFQTTKKGLMMSSAKKRLEQNGKNELPKKEQDNIFELFFSQFQNPIELILVITVILSLIVKEYIDGIALIFIILIDVIMGTYQEWKAKKEANSLIHMIKVTSKIIRENKELEMDSSDIVVGDILLLESGDKIPADARIIECYNLSTDESSLTGESINIMKNNEELKKETILAERTNMVYAGTTVITGRAVTVVVATSTNTELGHIATNVVNIKEEKSPLTIRIEKFSKQISIIIMIIAMITTIILLKKGYSTNEIFLCVIALSVSAMPEGLPLALTMALTIASKKMAKKNVIVKNLNAVESLGSCTVIASDKTGTLTINEQTAKEIVMANGETFLVSGTGYNDIGIVTPIENAKLESAIYIASLGALNNEAHFQKEKNKFEFFGDSIDIAFLSLASKLNIQKNIDVIERIPYESENQYSAVFYQKEGEMYCTIKGSLEKVMEFSEKNEKYYQQNESLTKKGYRVIAIADGKVNGTTKEDIKNLTFVGMVAFIDPIRKEVKKSIEECKEAGIKVIMITGDHPFTAFSIAKELGLCERKEEVATGRDIEKYRSLGKEEWNQFIRSIKVFSRVTPTDKLDIVESLKQQGEFVAVTGDGVNDAPAIKSASIGISMGSGTDVAKEAASMIVIDDNFTSIVSGVREGRIAYSNIRKIILFLLSCGFAEVCFFLLSISLGYDIPLLAIQLLWLNIVTDGLQDIALSFENDDKNIRKEKPRNTKESLFSKDLMIEVSILGITISIIIFGIWKYMLDNHFDMIYARSVIMMLMVFIQNINVLNCRSEKESIFKKPLFHNKMVLFTIIGSIVLQIIVSEIKETAIFFKITPLPFVAIIQLFFVSFLIIIVYEIYKIIYKKIIRKDNL